MTYFCKTKFIIIILLSMIFLTFSQPVYAAERLQPIKGEKLVIVIDPGHGGDNLGTIENGCLEKSMTLITAQAMYEELSKYDNVVVYMTRTDDVELSMKERTNFAKSVNADFLFSIHYNASVKHDLFGSEVWISSVEPFNAYGYQFAYQQMLTMKEMGLYLRGIKTKLNKRGTDYYGIIRESTARSIPSVIIEHSHVDEERDYVFCDSHDDLIAFGKADATSVAKYFGLSSKELGVNYSTVDTLPLVEANVCVSSSLADQSEPELCEILLKEANYDTGKVTLQVMANDSESPLIYYDYSYNGGMSYSPRQEWPNCNVLDGSYDKEININIKVPSGSRPLFIVRVYNMYDLFTESNHISAPKTFRYQNIAIEKNINEYPVDSVEIISKEAEKNSFSSPILLILILIIMSGFSFCLYIIFQMRKSHRRNVSGDKKYHR